MPHHRKKNRDKECILVTCPTVRPPCHKFRQFDSAWFVGGNILDNQSTFQKLGPLTRNGLDLITSGKVHMRTLPGGNILFHTPVLINGFPDAVQFFNGDFDGAAVASYSNKGFAAVYGEIMPGAKANGPAVFGNYLGTPADDTLGIAVAGISSGIGVFGSGPFAGYFNGNVHVTGVITSPSDRKVKTNLVPLSDPLSKLGTLVTYSHTYDQKASIALPKGKNISVMADDIEKVFPELVSVTKLLEVIPGRSGITSKVVQTIQAVNYNGLVAVLIGAVNELSQRVSKLEGKGT